MMTFKVDPFDFQGFIFYFLKNPSSPYASNSLSCRDGSGSPWPVQATHHHTSRGQAASFARERAERTALPSPASSIRPILANLCGG